MHERVKMRDATAQVIELNPKCSGQAHSKGSRTGSEHENLGVRMCI